MERLSPLDAAFLDLEDSDRHASLAIAAIPRARQRVLRHALNRLVARIMAQRLDRDRPLRECWVIEGLAGDRGPC